MPRQARLDAPGTLHHVIVRGIERRKIVKDDSDRAAFVERIGTAATDTKTIVCAWALLDNHAHLLVRSGPELLTGFMRRLLTRHAIYFNRRHRRHGHVFQNRYKSIVCDEDEYFAELVRFIHLNPLRARIAESRRPELVGGGLVRSLGGWSEVLSMRRRKERTLTDERVLGSGTFIENLLADADERVRRQIPETKRARLVVATIARLCKEYEVNRGELENGSTRRHVSAARREVVRFLAKEHGVPLATIARSVGVSTSGAWRILERIEEKSK